MHAALAAASCTWRSRGSALIRDGVLAGLLHLPTCPPCGEAGEDDGASGPSTSGRAAASPLALHVELRRYLSAQREIPSASTPASSGPGASTSSSSTTAASAAAAATPPSSWLLRQLPPAAVPYAQLMRLDKPIGTWLLALPCFWSIALAAQPGQLPDLWLMALFGIGAVLLRGAGCTINDLWDRDLDARVERTRSRPLASGALQPRHALALLAAQLALGLVVLLQLNDYSKLLGASSLLLVGTYPLMKRVTFWPQAVLGLTINWGALLGYAAVTAPPDWAVVLPLYGAGVAWTLVYDTIYAHQDVRDDAAAGVRSTALLFGERSKVWFAGFTAVMGAGLAAAGSAAGCGLPYALGVAAMVGHVTWQVATVDLANGPDCSAKFGSNKVAGGLLLAGIVADRLLAAGA